MSLQRNVTKQDQAEIDTFVEYLMGYDNDEKTYCGIHGLQKAVGNYNECEQCLIDYKNEQMDKEFGMDK